MDELEEIEKSLDKRICAVDHRGIAPAGSYPYYLQKAFAALDIEMGENKNALAKEHRVDIEFQIFELSMNLQSYLGVSRFDFLKAIESYRDNQYECEKDDMEHAGSH